MVYVVGLLVTETETTLGLPVDLTVVTVPTDFITVVMVDLVVVTAVIVVTGGGLTATK